MNAEKRFLRFKLAAASAVLVGAGALAYSQGWVGVKNVTASNGETSSYFTLPGRPHPEQAAEALANSLNRFEGIEVQGPYLQGIVGKVLEHMPTSSRHGVLSGLEGFIVQDGDLLRELTKYGVEKKAFSEADASYIITTSFDGLSSVEQREALLELYDRTDPANQVSLVTHGLLANPGAVAKELASGAYEEIRLSIKSAGDWTFEEGSK